MSNQWWRQPRGKLSQEFGTLAIGIVIIGIIGYLFFPSLFKDIYSLSNPTVAATTLNNAYLPSTDNPNALNSSSSSSQLFPSVNNTVNIGSEKNVITSGYWVLYVSNGTSQQLSVNAQDYAFIQELIQSDSRGSATVTIFLIDNGQIHQYVVSNEVYSVISNIATIETRASNTSTYSIPPTTTLPTTTISETLTVINPSSAGFTVVLSPALKGLTISNFTLVDSLENPVTLTGATTSVDGASYAITAALSAGKTYILSAEDAGYTFETAQSVVVPQ